MLVGVIAAGSIANRWGVIAALVAPALAMVVAMPLFVGVSPGLMSVGAFLGGALGVGYSGVTPVLTTSLFPEHVRARAIGIVYHAGALIAAFVPAGIPWISAQTGMSLQLTIGLVVGAGLVAMSIAVLALRHRLVMPAAVAPAAVPLTASGVRIVKRDDSLLPGQLLEREAPSQIDAR
jgi:SHS family lactate transporter-like MFS transporter